MSGRVVVLVKRTSYRKFVVEDKDPRVTKLLRRKDPAVRRMRSSHEQHEETVDEVRKATRALGLTAEFLEGPRTPIRGSCELVVTVGGDGTLLTASHQVPDGVPLLGINSAPTSSVGFFCGSSKGRVERDLRLALAGKMPRRELSRMKVELNGKVLAGRVLNDALFCHSSPAATSRYLLELLREDEVVSAEEQRSSGIWIGPAAGSTAAQKSAGGRVLPLSSRNLQFVVREPYTPMGSRLKFSKGLVSPHHVFRVRSKMREARIFLDGPLISFDIGFGDVVSFCRSEQSLTVLGLVRRR